MIVEKLAYKVTLRAEDFLSGKKKVEEGVKGLTGKISEGMEGASESATAVGTAVKKTGQQLTKTANDTRRPFSIMKDGFSWAKKEAKEFRKESNSAFGDIQVGMAKYLGLSLGVEVARRTFASSTGDLVNLGNAASFLGMEAKQVDGFTKAAESAGSSAENMLSVLGRVKDSQNWKKSPIGDPSSFTAGIYKIQGEAKALGKVIDILNAPDPGEGVKRLSEALSILPKSKAQQLAGSLGGLDTGMFELLYSRNLDKLQEKMASQSDKTPEMIQRAKEVNATMVQLSAAVKGVGDSMVESFGKDAVRGMETFSQYIKDNKGEILGFFSDVKDGIKGFSDFVGGAGNAASTVGAAYALKKGVGAKSFLGRAGMYGLAGTLLYDPIDSVANDYLGDTDAGKFAKNHGVFFSSDYKVFFNKESYEKYQSALDASKGKSEQKSKSSNIKSRGVRNNNPGNLDYVGQSGASLERVGGRFAKFDTPEAGLNAMSNQLMRYFEGKTTGRQLKTISDIVSTWAPRKENDTAAYIDAISKRTGIPANKELNLRDPSQIAALMNAMIHHENGGNPYSQEQITRASLYPMLRRGIPDYKEFANHHQDLARNASIYGSPQQPGNIDNSETNSTHINSVYVTTPASSMDELSEDIKTQVRRSKTNDVFRSANR
ncbi:hypothetical protein [Serratia sp. UGAL515B_01]|uniref:hypothetical protein n=1 Tax=Serratia sp. UGAL515B_01 TaxID=2986763 RepID=UPI0029546807|nr:hypothetical protein [Serratia sp. UGAL515B_01]WON77019.1 hypothetical protein OK023_17920 [Serratia sp. UGAL515B_01]